MQGAPLAQHHVAVGAESSEGLVEVDERCANCRWHRRTRRSTPRVSADSSSSSSSSDSSSGGSSSGGGGGGGW